MKPPAATPLTFAIAKYIVDRIGATSGDHVCATGGQQFRTSSLEMYIGVRKQHSRSQEAQVCADFSRRGASLDSTLPLQPITTSMLSLSEATHNPRSSCGYRCTDARR
jgi:hypothetical protein